jgi:hypothetical protein
MRRQVISPDVKQCEAHKLAMSMISSEIRSDDPVVATLMSARRRLSRTKALGTGNRTQEVKLPLSELGGDELKKFKNQNLER